MPGEGRFWRAVFSLSDASKSSKKWPWRRRFRVFRARLQNPAPDTTFPAPMKTLLLPLAALSTALAMTQPARAELKVGENAPAVTGVTETGQKLNLADVYPKQTYTLVYFYPKADTPGCTAQGCSLRDGYESLTAKGVAVIGVSHDDVAAQKAFKEKYHLPFTLIADTDNAVINAFGVSTYPGGRAMRSAYLIKGGKIVYADYKGTTSRQAEVILGVLAADKG